MTTERVNGIYMRIIGFLLAALVATILYVWHQAEARLTTVEQNSQTAITERQLLLKEDGHIIEKINEFKKSVYKRFDKLEERIGQ